MSAPPRPAARPAWLTRRTIARSSVLGLGLLVTAGTTPAAAVAAQDGEGTSPSTDSGEAEARTAGAPLNIAPAGNSDKHKNNQGNAGQGSNGQGTPGQGTPGQGNENPGGGTPGNNTPGTNDAGHPNGGTGDSTDEGGDGDVVTPPLVAGFGTGKQFALAVSTTGPVPNDLQLSGAQFTFTPVSVMPFPIGEGAGVTSPLPGPVTCTTDALGTCTVTGGFGVPAVTDGGSDVLLPFGSYTVTQTVVIPGLGSVPWANEPMTLCFIGCDATKPISAINPSLFRQQITATVVDDAGAVVADAGYSLDGPDFPRPTVDPDASPTLPAVATSDGDGVLVLDGWFAPGNWTFTPTATAPDGSAFLAETQELVTTAAEADAATPWDVQLLLSTGQPTDGGDGTGDGDGDIGTGDGDTGTGDGETGTGDGETGTGDGETGGGDTGGAEGPDPEGPGPGPGRPVPDAGNPGTGNPGTGNPGTGNPGTGNPGTGNPGTGNPGTPPGGAAAPAAPSEAGNVGTAGTPGDDQPAGQAAPTTSPAPTTPSSRATTSTPSRSSTAPSLPPEFVLTESTPELQTVSFGFREAGLAAFGVVFLGAVFFGLLLFRRRSRRQR